MGAIPDIRNGSRHVSILSMVFCLTLLQVQLTNCFDHGILRRMIRSLSRPDSQMVAPVQLYEPTIGPTVPFLGELSEKLTVGKVIKIHGYVAANAKRFDINLCSDCYEGPMQFHISIRFDPEDIVRNNYDGSKGWGSEDRTGSSVLPVALDSEFDVVIEVNQDNYKISIDGRRNISWTFAHRMPFADVNKVEILGNVLIWKIEYTDKSHQVISTSTSTDASQRYRNQLNVNANNALTIDIRNPSDTIERFSVDLRCECVPQNSTS